MSPGIERAARRSGRGFALLVVCVVLVSLLFVRLGFWQLERHRQRAQFNETIAATLQAPPLDLTPGALADLARDPGRAAYRTALARGAPRGSAAFLLRGRTREGSPGVHLIVPLQLPAGPLLLVDRGWIPAPDAVRIDPAPYLEDLPLRYEGILFPLHPEDGAARPLRVEVGTREVETVARLEPSVVERLLGAEVLPLYLRELPSSDAGSPPFASPAPEAVAGPHLSYAVQWFSFASIAIIGLLILAHRRRLHGVD